MIRNGINLVKLVFAPFSNREGQWFWDDGELREALAASRLYLICQREEVFFSSFSKASTSDPVLQFDLQLGQQSAKGVRLPLRQLVEQMDAKIEVSAGPKIIRFFEVNGEERKLVQWFTPDKMLFLHSRGDLELENFGSFPAFDFKLHYVGISKQHGSFARLFDTAHEARSRILSLENPIRQGAALSDEITILLLDVEPGEIQTWGDPHDLSKDDDTPPPDLADHTRIIADVEKALVKVLRPVYNSLGYENYPAGIDGLANEGFDRYFFILNDSITIRTSTETLRGGDLYEQDRTRVADMITVSGGTVTLKKLREESVEVTPRVAPGEAK